jgi:hypothetical protein
MCVMIPPRFAPNPMISLGVLVAITVIAVLIEAHLRRLRRRALQRVAKKWGMTYSPRDRLRLTNKIIGRLPIPGAADVHVSDLIYGGEGERYRYVFTAEYTLGLIRGKRREVRVGTFGEPRGRVGGEPAESVIFAPEDLSIIEQYEHFQSIRSKPAATSG